MTPTTQRSCPAIRVSIFMAGDIEAARVICREYCDEIGLCVTVTPTSYIYTGGQEDGFVVGLINYPRFPSNVVVIQDHAMRLAVRLREQLGQQSFTIQTDDEAHWYSWRGGESPASQTT